MLAYERDRLIALLASSCRRYLVGGQPVTVREAADWFCLPEYRSLGLGVQLMSNLMDKHEPLLVIGGNSDSRSVLGALGWYRLPDIPNYTLPLTARAILTKASRLLHLSQDRKPASLGKRSWISSIRLRRPNRHSPSLHSRAASDLSDEFGSAATMYGLAPLTDKQELEWLYAAPQVLGRFFHLRVPETTGTAGFVLGRLYSYDDLKYAKLIHLQTSSASVQAYRRLLGEVISYVNDQGVDLVQCRASSPFLRQALKRSGFIYSGSTPAHWWSKDGNRLQGNFHLTFLRVDDAIRPYPQ